MTHTLAEKRARVLRKMPSLGQGVVCVCSEGRDGEASGRMEEPQVGEAETLTIDWKEYGWWFLSQGFCLTRDGVASEQHGLKKAAPEVEAGEKGTGTIGQALLRGAISRSAEDSQYCSRIVTGRSQWAKEGKQRKKKS